MKVLREKFLADEKEDISYAQFTRYVPTNILKPKPEDWGTCLCMSCINPEHKLESLHREMPECSLNINNFMNKTEDELEILFKKIENSGKQFRYLEWTKTKTDNKSIKTLVYNAKKVFCELNVSEFVKKLRNELSLLKEHTERMISQF